MKCNLENYVAVVDSGVGGLTILKQLQHKFTACNFVYIADSAHCPYGTKTPSEILRRAETIVDFVQRCGAQSVVVACNTASVLADKLRAKFCLPIFDVIAPTCHCVAKVSQTKRVALLATNATVASGVYQRKLAAHGIAVVAFPCSSFVPFVEANAVDTPDCDAAVSQALRDLPRCNVDTVILGCTHFPLLCTKIAPYCNGAKIVECVTDFEPLATDTRQAQSTIYLTTCCENASNCASKWFGDVNFVHVDL